MRGAAFIAWLLLAGAAIGACAPPYGHDRRHPREMDERDAWEIVRRDPCRYDEYRRFAEKHKNPEKRRQVVWRLAHDGCSRERAYDYDRDDDRDGYR